MSDDERVLEEVAQKYGMTPDEYRKAKRNRGWQSHQWDMHMQGVGMMTGQPGTEEQFAADEIDKALEERRAKEKAKRENIEGWLRVQNQEQGQDFFLKVMVDTGATVNAITHGVLLDHGLQSRITKLEKPHELNLAVGSSECDEQISIPWVGKGNQRYGTATFYVLPCGKANINHRAILSKEWLQQRDLLCDEDERDSLKPLMGGRESAAEKAVRERARQQAKNDQASSAKAKGGQKDQDSSSKGSSGPKEAGK
ncbi:hypothetical protein F5883DRAFT_587564 [Diaporthe sp. PMI_573]|nr:hypothetical protein F5883DRAFT_587564 [Diaporthaceae sp. PMI_573]